MNALIGDRFLKQFFGRRMPRHSANPPGETLTLLEYPAEKPAEQGCPNGEGQLIEKATPENEIKRVGQGEFKVEARLEAEKGIGSRAYTNIRGIAE